MIFELRSIVHGRFIIISTGNFAGSWRGKEKSMPKAGLRGLGQGSRIRTRSRGGWAGSRHRVLKMETKVVGGRDTQWKVLERAWVMGMRGSEFWYCMECNTWVLSIVKHERSRLGGGVDSIVVCELSEGDPFIPIILRWLTNSLRYCSISWLIHSVWPSVCGWYAVEAAVLDRKSVV